MATIKIPQTVSHSKNSGGRGGNGFITMLLFITWIVIAVGFYAVKTGIIQSTEVTTANEKLTLLESNLTSLDARLKTIEKRLVDASSILSPELKAKDTEINPESAITPENEKPAAPLTPEDTKKTEDNTVTTPSVDPLLTEPKDDEVKKPEEKGTTIPAKPQTNNKSKSGATDNTAFLEKKNYN